MNILDKSSAQILKEYKELQSFVYSLPATDRWKYGAQLKTLKNSFFVVKESEQVRNN